jgi:hypothetical protein
VTGLTFSLRRAVRNATMITAKARIPENSNPKGWIDSVIGCAALHRENTGPNPTCTTILVVVATYLSRPR